MKGGGGLPVSGTPPPRMEVGEVRVAEDSDFALLKVCVLYIVCTMYNNAQSIHGPSASVYDKE